jgi:HSP20 family molecular chaperone IbpA
MKFYISAAALPVLVSSYNMGTGGFRYYRSPDTSVSPGRVQEEGSSCGPGSQAAQQQQQEEWVDRAFQQLESEFNGTPNRRRRAQEGREDVVDRAFEQLETNSNGTPNRGRRAQEGREDVVDRAFEQLQTEFFNNNGTPNRRRRAQRREDVVNNRDNEEDKARQQPQEEYLRKQQEWVNRAFGLATEVASDIVSSSGRDVKETKNEAARQQQEWLNRAFGLATEVASDIASSSSPPRRDVKEAKNEAVQQQHEDVVNKHDEKDEAPRQQQQQQQQQQQEYLRKQQEWVNRAFGLSPEASSGRDAEEAKKESVRQQQEWLNQAFGLATNAASGLSSPRYEVNDGNDAFQVALDVPGVKASDIDISFNEDDSVLKVSGKRDMDAGGVTRSVKFSKSFSLDSSAVNKDKISAQINNGVLLVTVPKVPIENKGNKVRKIPVKEVGPENVPVQGPTGSAASDKPSPESKSSQAAEEPTDGKKKDDEKPREDPNPEKV